MLGRNALELVQRRVEHHESVIAAKNPHQTRLPERCVNPKGNGSDEVRIGTARRAPRNELGKVGRPVSLGFEFAQPPARPIRLGRGRFDRATAQHEPLEERSQDGHANHAEQDSCYPRQPRLLHGERS